MRSCFSSARQLEMISRKIGRTCCGRAARRSAAPGAGRCASRARERSWRRRAALAWLADLHGQLGPLVQQRSSCSSSGRSARAGHRWWMRDERASPIAPVRRRRAKAPLRRWSRGRCHALDSTGCPSASVGRRDGNDAEGTAGGRVTVRPCAVRRGALRLDRPRRPTAPLGSARNQVSWRLANCRVARCMAAIALLEIASRRAGARRSRGSRCCAAPAARGRSRAPTGRAPPRPARPPPSPGSARRGARRAPAAAASARPTRSRSSGAGNSCAACQALIGRPVSSHTSRARTSRTRSCGCRRARAGRVDPPPAARAAPPARPSSSAHQPRAQRRVARRPGEQAVAQHLQIEPGAADQQHAPPRAPGCRRSRRAPARGSARSRTARRARRRRRDDAAPRARSAAVGLALPMSRPR